MVNIWHYISKRQNKFWIIYYHLLHRYMLSSTSSWLFFVLLNAYYGGALTMFFTSEAPIPFNTIEDVMISYPTWKLKMMAGNDVYFQYKALEGDPLYKEFFQRTKTNPKNSVYQTVDQGLIQMKYDQVVLHIGQGNLLGHFKANPFWSQKIKTFDKGRPEFMNHILPKNSPLTPLLRRVQLKLVESGTLDYLKMQWQVGI